MLSCEHPAHEEEEFQLFRVVAARYAGQVLKTLVAHVHQADSFYRAYYEFVEIFLSGKTTDTRGTLESTAGPNAKARGRVPFPVGSLREMAIAHARPRWCASTTS